jgi:putative hydroxymethylpyrimidine transport system substrate-binding protein
VTIGFNAVTDLAAGKVDAATGFWNAEAVALARRGIKVRTFRVDDYGAPAYPELVLVTTRELLNREPSLVRSVASATTAGYRAVVRDPAAGLAALLAADPSLDRDEQRAELRLLLPAFSPPGLLRPAVLRGWARWDVSHGILEHRLDPRRAFVPLSR